MVVRERKGESARGVGRGGGKRGRCMKRKY